MRNMGENLSEPLEILTFAVSLVRVTLQARYEDDEMILQRL
jgi:hypothetical protein